MNTADSTLDASSRHCWRLTVRDTFAAAHALRNYCGKCENLHGHNFSVAAEVEGTTLAPDTGLLLDFGILKQGLKTLLEDLDHRVLNELAPFSTINPSSENLARHIFYGMKHWLETCEEAQAQHVRLVSITVGETDKQCATYMAWQDARK